MASGQLIETADIRMHYLQRGTGDPSSCFTDFPRPRYRGGESFSGSILALFSRLVRSVNAGHFFLEGDPGSTNRALIDFLKARI